VAHQLNTLTFMKKLIAHAGILFCSLGLQIVSVGAHAGDEINPAQIDYRTEFSARSLADHLNKYLSTDSVKIHSIRRSPLGLLWALSEPASSSVVYNIEFSFTNGDGRVDADCLLLDSHVRYSKDRVIKNIDRFCNIVYKYKGYSTDLYRTINEDPAVKCKLNELTGDFPDFRYTPVYTLPALDRR
jgi:hypothetical protein